MRRHKQQKPKRERKLPRRGRDGTFVRSGRKRRKRKNPRRRAAALKRKRNAKGLFV